MDLLTESVMILGLDFWPNVPFHRRINEPRLEALLKVEEFHVPISDKVDAPHVPCRVFPLKRVCQTCKLVAPAHTNSKKQFVCPDPTCKGRTNPARFVVACVKGHIDDFPWSEWVHRGPACADPKLYFRSRGRSAALSDLYVECEGCKATRTMEGALSKGKKGVSSESVLPACAGSRPWLRDGESCKARPRGLLRGASNVYFSVTASSLSIPPWTDSLHLLVVKHWPTIAKLIQEGKSDMLKGLIPVLFPGESEGDVMAAIARKQGLAGMTDLRTDEWLVLRSRTPICKNDFELVPQTVPAGMESWIEDMAVVPRLREVRSLVGFTRIDPPDQEAPPRPQAVPISRSPKNWLPAVEVFGEGVFLAINHARLVEWEKKGEVVARSNRISDAYRNWKAGLGQTVADVPPRYILLHTLAHVLIREFSLESGYSSASIGERVYASPNAHGVLLYTAADDSEGSLGGLVQQGKPENFEAIMRNALEGTALCSSDPLCAENDPQITETTNGAACHVCTFVSETSCERSNRLLDRVMVIPAKDNETSFFSDLEDTL